jgi:hypothetical protein
MTNPDTLAAVEQACADLTADGDTVTFAAVAERTGLSRTTLYRDDWDVPWLAQNLPGDVEAGLAVAPSARRSCAASSRHARRLVPGCVPSWSPTPASCTATPGPRHRASWASSPTRRQTCHQAAPAHTGL